MLLTYVDFPEAFDPETIKTAYQDLEKEIIKAGYKITSESFDFEGYEIWAKQHNLDRKSVV